MEPREQQRLLESARGLEKRGNSDGAAELFIRAGAPEEAARVLSAHRRFDDAGQLLLNYLGVETSKIGQLPPERKKLAFMAAACLSRGREPKRAVDIFLQLGEQNRAAEILSRSGDTVGAAKVLAAPAKATSLGGASLGLRVDHSLNLQAAQKLEASGRHELAIQAYIQLRRPGEAGRVARQIGKMEEAGELFAEGGLAFEAGSCFLQAGNGPKSLDNFCRVSKDHPKYRAAALQAIQVACTLKNVGFQFDHFLTQFIATGPLDAKEMEAFYQLSKLYEQTDFIENAKEVLRKIVASNPRYRDAEDRLYKLAEQTRRTTSAQRKLIEDDAAFWSDQKREPSSPKPTETLPDLPDLPDFPGLRDSPPAKQVKPSSPPKVPIRPTPTPAGAGLAFFRSVDRSIERIGAELVADGGTPGSAVGSTLFEVKSQPSKGPSAASKEKAKTEILSFQPGSTLGERYRLNQKIGQGGMATVFRATDLELGEEIAIKVFNQTIDDEQAMARFRQELKLSRQLSHPNIVRLFDIGSFQGHRYITMELLIGADLKTLFGKPLAIGRGTRYLIQACAALQTAHDIGIVHRDVKPENFFVTEDDALKVMDFGIAKQQQGAGLTVAGMIAGTPEYMSPEQINNFGKVTHSTDIYALGVIAYEMFTGKVPFYNADLMPLLMMHVQQRPPPPRKQNPSIPEDLENIILRLLEKEPSKRFPSCKELAQALTPISDRFAA